MAKGKGKNTKKTGRQKNQEAYKGYPDIFSPEGFLVIMWAFVLDLLSLIDLIPGLGNIAAILVQVLGMSTLGVWSFMKTGHLPPRARNRHVLKKPITRGLVGFIPFMAVFPWWSFWVVRGCIKGGSHKASVGALCFIAIFLGIKIALGGNILWIF
ncbi:MAG: hypothetical protein WDZ39_00675 [Candidatus Spechtbacterales bacterium]